MLPTAAFTDWLTGVSGALVFIATAVLAVVAVIQMRALSRQAQDEAAAIDKQIAASVEQGEAIREAARAQLQPMVFAHGGDTYTGRQEAGEREYDLGLNEVGFGYKLANEGTGLALNVRHGVEVGDRQFEFGEGMQFRSLRPGEWQPAQDFVDRENRLVRVKPLAVRCYVDELPADWATEPRHYWAEFENVFGERFRTRNPSDPQKPAEFQRALDSCGPPARWEAAGITRGGVGGAWPGAGRA